MNRATYSPDGKLLAVSDYNTIHLYDADTKKELRTWVVPEGNRINSMAFSPDSKILATAHGRSPRLRQWDAGTGKLIREFDSSHLSGARFITFSPDGKLLATVGDDLNPKFRPSMSPTENVRIWDATTGKESAAFASGLGSGWGECVAFSPDGKFLAWGSGWPHKVHVRKMTGGDDVFVHLEKDKIEGPSIYSVSFSPDGKFLAAGDGEVIKLFEMPAGKLLKTLAQEPKADVPSARRRLPGPILSRREIARFDCRRRDHPLVGCGIGQVEPSSGWKVLPGPGLPPGWQEAGERRSRWLGSFLERGHR